MTDQDHKAARREIADALLKALERRHEVLDLIVEADNKPEAVKAIAGLLDTSHTGAEAVFGLSFDRLTKDSRKTIQAELEDLNKQLSFTLGERPASSGDTLELRPFSASEDRDIFSIRTEDMGGASGDGSGGQAGNLDDEIKAALARVDDEEAAWFVAIDSGEKVGMVFGELSHGEVQVRVWIHPEHRKRGYGTAALRKSRSELAWCFPAAPLVVRAPAAKPD